MLIGDLFEIIGVGLLAAAAFLLCSLNPLAAPAAIVGGYLVYQANFGGYGDRRLHRPRLKLPKPRIPFKTKAAK